MKELLRGLLGGGAMTKFLFVVAPLMVGFSSLYVAKGMYLTCDEVDMRMILEGLAGTRESGPTPFCLYLNVLYGHVLCFFYRHFPGGYWYDAFNYLWLSLSMVVLGWTACGTSLRRNALSLVILLFLAALLFACPQFTLTAAILAVAGCAAGLRFVRGEGAGAWGWAALSLFLVAVSSLVRFEATMMAAFVFGGAFLIVAKRPSWAFLRRAFALAAVLLAATVGLKCAGDRLVAANPEWHELARLNAARSYLCDKTGLWGRPLARADELVACACEGTAEGGRITREDLHFLLSFCMIGRDSVFNAGTLCDTVAVVKRRLTPIRGVDVFRGFEDPFGLGWWRFALLLVIGGIVAGVAWWRLGVLGLFLFGVSFFLLWHETRLPDRVWLGIFMAAVAAVLLLQTEVEKPDIGGRTRRVAFAALTLVALCLSVQGGGVLFRGHTICQYLSYRDVLDADIPKNYHVVMDIGSDAPMLRAFHPFTLGDRKVLFASPFVKFPDNLALARAWGIGGEDAWERVCASASDVRFLLPLHGCLYFTCKIFLAVERYMRVRHGQRVLAMFERVGRGVVLVRLRALDDAERSWHEAFRKDLPRPISQHSEEVRRRAAAYVAKVAYPHAEAPSRDEQEWMLVSGVMTAENMFGDSLEKR